MNDHHYINNAGIALLKQFEGFESKVYICPAGKATIGYGHVVTKLEADTYTTITEAQATDLLRKDAAKAEGSIKRTVTKRLLTSNQFSAIVCLVYNIGSGAFTSSTICKLLNSDTLPERKHFVAWSYAGGKQLPGLIRRREAEYDLFSRRD